MSEHPDLAGKTALITERGGRATVIVSDIRDPKAVQALAGAAVDADGHVDIFVNNAGVSYLDTVVDGTPDQWSAMLDTNGWHCSSVFRRLSERCAKLATPVTSSTCHR